MCASSQPFFLTASFLKPHDPFMPVERFARMFHPADMTLPTSWGKVDLSTVPKFVADQIRLFTRSNGRITSNRTSAWAAVAISSEIVRRGDDSRRG
jgi:hypothetical protein